jgi:hypothetical protein
MVEDEYRKEENKGRKRRKGAEKQLMELNRRKIKQC